LANAFSRFHVELGKVAIKGSADWALVFNLNGQAIPPRIPAADNPAREGRNHGRAFWSGEVTPGMHDPGPEDRMEPPAEVAGGDRRSNERKQQATVAIASNGRGARRETEHISEAKTTSHPG
jgi:hypothetical protein